YPSRQDLTAAHHIANGRQFSKGGQECRHSLALPHLASTSLRSALRKSVNIFRPKPNTYSEMYRIRDLQDNKPEPIQIQASFHSYHACYVPRPPSENQYLYVRPMVCRQAVSPALLGTDN